MADVRIPSAFLKYSGDAALIEVDGVSVREVLEFIEREYPLLGGKLMKEGRVSRFVHIFVDGEDIRFKGGLDTVVRKNSEILIVPAISGG